MKKVLELPIIKPLYSTYHHQGNGTAILKDNPSIRNWYYNNAMQLQCNRRFLEGYTTPELTVDLSNAKFNPYLQQYWIPIQYLDGYVHHTIRALLNDGYYVAYMGVDDYYVEGKTWYHERHFDHDGLICGYNQFDKTYTLYAYDSKWKYRVFQTSQKGFEQGRRSMVKQGVYGNLRGFKPSSEQVELNPKEVCDNLIIYLDSGFEKYPLDGYGDIFGWIVHEYIMMYMDRLIDGSVPYDRMDWRIFRMIWEHKTVMQERMRLVEEKLLMSHELSDNYREIVNEADTLRMLFATHHMKRRDSLLPIIRKRLDVMAKKEKELLLRFTDILGNII